jgi:hypothetical protein
MFSTTEHNFDDFVDAGGNISSFKLRNPREKVTHSFMVKVIDILYKQEFQVVITGSYCCLPNDDDVDFEGFCVMFIFDGCYFTFKMAYREIPATEIQVSRKKIGDKNSYNRSKFKREINKVIAEFSAELEK